MYKIVIYLMVLVMLCSSCGFRVDENEIKVKPTPLVSPTNPVESKDNEIDEPNSEDKDTIDNPKPVPVINEETVIKLLSMNDEEFIEFLGDSYTIEDEYPSNPDYIFSEYGIGISYDTDSEKVIKIFIIDSNIQLFGINKTMKFSTVKSILGEGELSINEDYGTYILFYEYDDYSLRFYAIDDPENITTRNGFAIWPPSATTTDN